MDRAEDLVVIIPVRGRFAVLRRVLMGLARQTVQGFHTVVVIDGADQPSGEDLDADQVLQRPHGGPGAARNRGVFAIERPLVLFLGADMVPQPRLVEQHLATHTVSDGDDVVVLGHVDWHPDVAEGPIHRWMDRSRTQFDYAAIRDRRGQDVGFGRFYSCNVSLRREALEDVGGFDEDFIFYYEDLDLGWRLAQRGMRLIYEPDAIVHHLHRYDLDGLRRRFEGIALGERLMADKHPWFEPFFHRRIRRAQREPPARQLWARVVDRLPEGTRPRRYVERKADTWYHQQVADGFLDAWERAAEVIELRRYLGDDFEASLLARAPQAVQEEFALAEDETAFYRTSQAYLYDLTVFAMSGTKDPYHEELRRHVPPGSRVLDHGCGIGSDGLRLLEAGYDVQFADLDNPSSRYLRWRLRQRGLHAPVWDVEHDELPDGFDAAFAFDVVEHVPDPEGLLRGLEEVAELVIVNLLENDPEDHEHDLHHPLPIERLVARAEDRGLVSHTVHHGRSHLLVYAGTPTAVRR